MWSCIIDNRRISRHWAGVSKTMCC